MDTLKNQIRLGAWVYSIRRTKKASFRFMTKTKNNQKK